MKILNLTLRPATKAQWDAGVIDLPQETMALLFEALTFRATPTAAMVGARAEEITRIACMGATKPEAALIDAPPYLLSALEGCLFDADIRPVYELAPGQFVDLYAEVS